MTPQAESVLELFRSTGAYLQGHFRLTSGLHSNAYLQSALVLQHPESAEKLGRLLAAELRRAVTGPVAFVASPALGGLIIGHEVARALGTRFLFTERDAATKQMALRRGFTVTPGETAVVVEDVITTGGSFREAVEPIAEAGGTVLCCACLVDRSGGKADVGFPLVALATVDVPSYAPDEIPPDLAAIPAEEPGSKRLRG